VNAATIKFCCRAASAGHQFLCRRKWSARNCRQQCNVSAARPAFDAMPFSQYHPSVYAHAFIVRQSAKATIRMSYVLRL